MPLCVAMAYPDVHDCHCSLSLSLTLLPLFIYVHSFQVTEAESVSVEKSVGKVAETEKAADTKKPEMKKAARPEQVSAGRV